MRVLVSGGAGFIGSHVVQSFADSGAEVVVFDNFSSGHNVYNHSSVSYIKGDITSDEDVSKISGHFDYVVHLAAAISVAESMTNPQKYYENNIEGSRRIFEAAIRCGAKKVVSASSAAVYGDCGRDKITESMPYGGISPYAESKYRMEGLADSEGRLIGHEASSTRFIFCRFFNVYGPRQDPHSPYTGVMSVFMGRARDGNDLIIFGDGEQTRDFIYVSDLVTGIRTLLQSSDATSGAFNVGTEHQTTINDLAACVISLSNANIHVKHSEPRDGDIKYSVSSS